MSFFINPRILITLSQAQAMIDERSNGGFGENVNTPNGEWCLPELEALAVRARHALIDPKDVRGSVSRLVQLPFDTETAKSIIRRKTAANDISGITSSKGGRAWVDGTWTLEELEALCFAVRTQAGNGAWGAIEDLADTLQVTISPAGGGIGQMAYRKLLRAGINPEVVPRVWEIIHHHEKKGYNYPRILCAANQYQMLDATGNLQLINVAGPRHMSMTMSKVVGALGLGSLNKDPEELQRWIAQDEGFIDQFDNFYTREEAFVLATYNNQIVRETVGWPWGRLCSEQLY